MGRIKLGLRERRGFSLPRLPAELGGSSSLALRCSPASSMPSALLVRPAGTSQAPQPRFFGQPELGAGRGTGRVLFLGLPGSVGIPPTPLSSDARCSGDTPDVQLRDRDRSGVPGAGGAHPMALGLPAPWTSGTEPGQDVSSHLYFSSFTYSSNRQFLSTYCVPGVAVVCGTLQPRQAPLQSHS